MPSIFVELLFGLRLRIRFALTFISVTDTLCIKCLMTSDSSAPVCLAKELPILFTSLDLYFHVAGWVTLVWW